MKRERPIGRSPGKNYKFRKNYFFLERCGSFFFCVLTLCILFFVVFDNMFIILSSISIAANKKEMTIINSVMFSIASIKKRKKY